MLMSHIDALSQTHLRWSHPFVESPLCADLKCETLALMCDVLNGLMTYRIYDVVCMNKAQQQLCKSIHVVC